MTASPYEPAPPEMLTEIIRQAEARLAAQLTAGVAADQRAMTFASLLLAAAAVLFGAALATSMPFSRLGLVLAVGAGLMTAATMAIWSAQPSDWDYVGNTPSQWLGDVAASRALHSAMAETAEWYDDMISGNETVIAAASRTMRAAVLIAEVTIGLGAVGAVVVAIAG